MMNNNSLKLLAVFILLAAVGCSQAAPTTPTAEPLAPTEISDPVDTETSEPTETLEPTETEATEAPAPTEEATAAAPEGIGIVPEPGHWSGDTISFDVTADGVIQNLHVSLNMPTGSCGVDVTGDIPVEDGMFLVGSRDKDGNLGLQSIAGQFDTTTTASGEMTGAWMCGGGIGIINNPDWTAELESGS